MSDKKVSEDILNDLYLIDAFTNVINIFDKCCWLNFKL